MPAPSDDRAREAAPQPAPQPTMPVPAHAPAVQRVLALQRSAGNAAVGRLIQRYLWEVPQEENRRIPYHQGDYKPWGQSNVKHVAGPQTGVDAVFADNQQGAVDYPAAHAKEHAALVKVADELISLLVRRTDRAITSEDQMYMIGVIEHVDVLKQHTDGIKRIVVTRSAEQPKAFKEALQALQGLHGDFQVQETSDLPKVSVLKEAAPGIKTTGVDEARATLKDCAAKKLVLSVPPPKEGAHMTEVLYDPMGEHPVVVEHPLGTFLRYHHRQRVPSCSDCVANLPHLHALMTQKVALIEAEAKAAKERAEKEKAEKEQAAKEAAEKPPVEQTSAEQGPAQQPPSEKPFKAAWDPLVKPSDVVADPTSSAWAVEALKHSVPKSIGSPLTEPRKALSKAGDEFRARTAALEKGLLDYHWHETMGKAKEPRPELKGPERTAALGELNKLRDDVMGALNKASALVQNTSKNPFLRAESTEVKEALTAITEAVARATNGPEIAAIAKLEEKVSTWLGKFGALPQPAKKPEYKMEPDKFLAADRVWQDAISKLAEEKAVKLVIVVDVDAMGAATPTAGMLEKADERIRKAVEDVVNRFPFVAGQPGKSTIPFSYGKAKK